MIINFVIIITLIYSTVKFEVYGFILYFYVLLASSLWFRVPLIGQDLHFKGHIILKPFEFFCGFFPSEM